MTEPSCKAKQSPHIRSGSLKVTGTYQHYNVPYLDFFVSFTRDLIVWGSPGVIKAYENFRRGSSSSSVVLFLVDDILREIRRDLGNSNWGIKKGDLIKLFSKDPEELDRVVGGN